MAKLYGKAFILLLILPLVSCSSIKNKERFYVPVPGEEQVREQNKAADCVFIAEGYEENKNYAKAILYYKEALWHGVAEEKAVYAKLARCYALNSDWDNAESIYSSLLLLDEDNLALKTSLAYIAAMRGDLAKAELLYSSLSSEHIEDASLLKNYISILVAQKKYDESKAALSLLQERFPDDKAIPEIKSLLD